LRIGLPILPCIFQTKRLNIHDLWKNFFYKIVVLILLKMNLKFFRKVPSKVFSLQPEVLLLSVTTVLSFLFFLWNINSWHFAYVGDDWPFYIYALNHGSSSSFPNPLSFSGVYGTHSPLASIYQSLFMELFGQTNFAWRFSNIILIIPITIFFYKALKLSFNKEIALFSTILLQCSFYLANFFKIGYDNPQSLTLFILCLYLITRFSKTPTKKLGLFLGLAFGISFYIYFGPAFPLLLWPFFIPLIKMFKKKQTRSAIVILIITYVLLIIPLLSNLHSLDKLFFTLGKPSQFHVKVTVFNDFFLFYKNNDYFYNHFVVGPYLDTITQILCLIGTVVFLFHLRKTSYLYYVLSYITAVYFIGITSPDGWSPTTRGIFFLPYGFLFAGVGLAILEKSIKNKTAAFIFCWIIILAVATLNAYQSQIGVFNQEQTVIPGMSLLIQSFQQNQSAKKDVIILLSPSLNINIYINELHYMTKAYSLTTPYAIVQPSDFQCPSNPQKYSVLVFDNDFQALQRITSMQCGTSHLTYSILTPNTTIY
jgi:hypothetical protein